MKSQGQGVIAFSRNLDGNIWRCCARHQRPGLGVFGCARGIRRGTTSSSGKRARRSSPKVPAGQTGQDDQQAEHSPEQTSGSAGPAVGPCHMVALQGAGLVTPIRHSQRSGAKCYAEA